ncbi:uncharacterized protein G2W53_041116 [Senna tora]|uniref:Uncharacterized protein n=1 Tax=Senna tora TaxID=362788 RepID=A0A834SGJ7_9FABA|nr:uncharacterized protein G2W53_041116 [Senna tora]
MASHHMQKKVLWTIRCGECERTRHSEPSRKERERKALIPRRAGSRGSDTKESRRIKGSDTKESRRIKGWGETGVRSGGHHEPHLTIRYQSKDTWHHGATPRMTLIHDFPQTLPVGSRGA